MCLNTSTCSSRQRSETGACTCGGRGHGEHASGIHLRMATPADVPLLHQLAGELAAYEHLGHEFEATPELYERYLFGGRARAAAILAYLEGEPAGFAVWYPTYSTFSGRPGAFLEDLYVRPHLRNKGVGRALISGVAGEARTIGCSRLEWRALKWNEPALAFYNFIGAEPLTEWTTLRLAL